MKLEKIDFFIESDEFEKNFWEFNKDYAFLDKKNFVIKNVLFLKNKENNFYYDDTHTFYCEKPDECFTFKVDKPCFVCIPQNKIVNFSIYPDKSTDFFKIFDSNYLVSNNITDIFNKIDCLSKNLNEKFKHMHIPFDYWMCIGAVFGRLQRFWLHFDKDFYHMPKWFFISFEDIFHTLNPEYTLKFTGDGNELSQKVRNDFLKYFVTTFDYFNNHGIAFRLSDFSSNKKEDIILTRILENHIVYRNCKNKKIPFGVKINLEDNWLWEFTVKDNNYFRAVHIHPYDLFVKKHFQRGGYYHCFEQGYMAWNILFKNYWNKNKKYIDLFSGYDFDVREMKRAFSGQSTFPMKTLKFDKINDMLQEFTVEKNFLNLKNEKILKPAHINRIKRTSKFIWQWDLKSNIELDDVFAKDERGSYYKLDKNVVDNRIKNIFDVISCINKTNKDSNVQLDGENIKTDISCILHVEKNNFDNYQIIFGKYGRNYTFNNGFQKISSNDRLRFIINGEPVSEIDYSGLHLQMLYAIEGINYEKEDVYDVGDWFKKHNLTFEQSRKAVKKMILIMINASSQSKMWYSFRKEWNEMNGNKKINLLLG